MPTLPAVQIRIQDHKIQAYLQRHPFADGPDPALNGAAREAIVAGLLLRPDAPDYAPQLIKGWQTVLSFEQDKRLAELFDTLHISPQKAATYREDFAWEANLLPHEKKSLLVVGCGDGVELIFLRALFPEARITAIDYHKNLLPGIETIVGVTFLEGDLNHHLKSLPTDFDLIFSNHTLEHLYTPDEVLSLLVSLLVPGGHLTSVLPLAGKEGTPFLEKIHAAVVHRRVNPLDMAFLDAGHPWKTNPGDLKQSFERVGLVDVQLYQRENHLNRFWHISQESYQRSRKKHILYNALFFGPVRSLLKLLFDRGIPARLPKLLFATERRTFFSTNKVMNRFLEEAMVIGKAI